MKQKNIFIITGYTGSGKTTLVNYLKLNGWSIISAGEIFTSLAQKHNVEKVRKSIQKFSIKYFNKYGYEEFSNLLLKQVSENSTNIIFEGIRPPKVIEIIKKNYPQTKIIFINTNKRLRYKRLVNRFKTKNIGIASLQNHPIEKDLSKVKKEADFIISNNNSIEKLIRQFNNICYYS